MAAIGVGAYWLNRHDEAVIARAEPSATHVAKDAATEAVDAAGRALPRRRPAATTASTEDPKPAPTAPPKASTPSRPRPTTPRSAAAPGVAIPSGAQGSTREVAAAPNVPAPVVAPPVHDVVETMATREAPAAPIGPFFETKDVTESPRIAARVEPKVPDALTARSVNEIVIVRALVSQSGHPSRVSLLRRSKTGPELDSIVVEAVNRWTFAPARKKGEPVSCWLNFAVQVGRAE